MRVDRLEAIVTVALALGLRRAEILGLRWEDIDLDRRTLTVRDRVNRVNRLGLIVPAGAKTEAGDQRTIVLPQTIIAALTTHRTRQLQTKLLAGSRWQGPAYTPATCAFAARARAVRQP